MVEAIVGSKRCPKCGDTKATTDFAVSRQCSDGRYTYCRLCQHKNAKKWRDSPKGKAYRKSPTVKAWNRSPKAKALRNEKCRRYRQREKLKSRARDAVRHAKRSGLIPRASELSCRFCGNPASDYHHHFGYAPEHHLDVMPLCKPCHRKTG